MACETYARLRAMSEPLRIDNTVDPLELEFGPERRAAAESLRARRTVTPREVEGRGGLSVDETAELMRALGLPAPGPEEPSLTAEEADVLCRLAELREVWPRN